MSDTEHRVITGYAQLRHGVQTFECSQSSRGLTLPSPRDMRYCPFCGELIGWKHQTPRNREGEQ